MTDIDNYQDWLFSKTAEWEAKCTNCGACCGALEDPCEHLRKDPAGWYFCEIYHQRFGEHRTVSGKAVRCVPIREKLAKGHSWPGDEHCGYKKTQGTGH